MGDPHLHDNDPEPANGTRVSWLVLAAVIGGIALFVWLFLAFLDWNKLQTCLSEGRRNCAERIYTH